ncbi:MAG: isoleucine--tRNA ligase [Coriobacteriia bacterium]|nr:isoleucine--tRNA ligase [Coriobacteriia bacterium]
MNLPKTDFPMRANLATREPAWVDFWQQNAIHHKAVEARREQGAPNFILHDGPPYANGHIHMGTAYNKILKDIVVKYKTMTGHYSPYVPGWDCHGQPIEHKVETDLGPAKMAEISKPELRALCRDYALKWIDVQREEFKRLGVLGDWDNPYLTLNHEYEAGNVEVFKRMYLDQVVYRGRKAIHWCMRCHTALAEAEIEYADVTSPSLYVAFEMNTMPQAFADALARKMGEKDISHTSKTASLVIWTTTPWTLPSNVAVTVAVNAAYVALVGEDGNLLVLAKERAEAVAEVLEMDVDNLPLLTTAAGDPVEVLGSDLTELTYKRPVPEAFPELDGRIVIGDHVELSTGTGAVHTATGHGHDDYLMGQKWGLETIMPVLENGVFDKNAGPFEGQHIYKANPQIVEYLRDKGTLLSEGKIEHSYPHCWRCKRPVIFRATEQWFVSMDHPGLTLASAHTDDKMSLREAAMAQYDSFRWIPDVSRNRMSAMIADRPDWCISRQRSWGVPIPAHRCTQCGEVVANEATFDAVIALFKERGADAWFTTDPADYLPAGTACEKCGCSELTPETDIVDVWWESGVSHTSVLEARPELHRPAQMYLEGSDQHRGWFQSSYLLSIGAYGEAPFNNLMTHGFTVDGEGRKMSKSIGNVISPIDITNKLGADIIRLWVATTDFSGDVGISDEILTRVSDSYRRIRNSLRFLLANTHDFDPVVDALSHKELLQTDKYWMIRLRDLHATITSCNDDWKFYLAQREAIDFLGDFSSLYIDVLKDRLYSDAAQSLERRSAQTVLAAALSLLVRTFAPVLAFTAEETWSFMDEAWKKDASGNLVESVHLCDWPSFELNLCAEESDSLVATFNQVLAVRDQVTKALEEARNSGLIGKSQEAVVTITAPADVIAVLQELDVQVLQEMFIVAEVNFKQLEASAAQSVASAEDNADGNDSEELSLVSAQIAKSQLEKCPRCWNYRTFGSDKRYPDVCARCAEVLTQLNYEVS